MNTVIQTNSNFFYNMMKCCRLNTVHFLQGFQSTRQAAGDSFIQTERIRNRRYFLLFYSPTLLYIILAWIQTGYIIKMIIIVE